MYFQVQTDKVYSIYSTRMVFKYSSSMKVGDNLNSASTKEVKFNLLGIDGLWSVTSF